MKYLKSTTDKSYTALGRVIPSSTKAPLAVNEDVYKKITDMKVIASLIRTGAILVLDKYTEYSNPADAQTKQLQRLSLENAKLSDRIRELEAQPTETASAKEVKAAKKAQSDAEAKLAELQAKYEALEAEANAKIAELSKTEESE